MVTWEKIYVHSGMDYSREKITTMQNPTIRYFTIFLANTLFERGDIGAMMGLVINVIHMSLHAYSMMRPNLGGLLITHFRHHRSNAIGDIHFGGLITQITYGLTIPIPAHLRQVTSTATMDQNQCSRNR
jgi:hypothetical protein